MCSCVRDGRGLIGIVVDAGYGFMEVRREGVEKRIGTI